jgi:hypothetical protein
MWERLYGAALTHVEHAAALAALFFRLAEGGRGSAAAAATTAVWDGGVPVGFGVADGVGGG